MRIYIPVRREFPNYLAALEALGTEASFTEPERCAAMLLPGGDDVDPVHYGQENKGSRDIDPERDRLELEAAALFLVRDRPVFGICRGCQVLNIALGGTLHQDIPGHRDPENESALHDSHTIDPLLRSLYGERFPVNTTHHQAIHRLGTGLRAVQWAPDGIIEAVRHETKPAFAVQWHPERLRQPIDGWKLIERWLSELT